MAFPSDAGCFLENYHHFGKPHSQPAQSRASLHDLQDAICDPFAHRARVAIT
jgi:hypothetical protein